MFAPKIKPMALKTARRRIKIIGKNHPLFKSLKHYIHESKCRNQKSKKWKKRRVKQFRLKKFKMPKIRKVFPQMIGEYIASVQPISLPPATIKYIFYHDIERISNGTNDNTNGVG